MVNAPQSLVSGETFVLTVQDARAVACVSMAAAAAPVAPGAIAGAFTADATPDPSTPGQWLIRADSKNWLPGDYQFELWADDAVCNRVLIDRGTFTVTASIDTRSLARRNVDTLEAYISGVGKPGVDQSVAEYKIKDRELRNYTLSEIRLLLGYWRRRLIREQREAMGLCGRPGIKVFV